MPPAEKHAEEYNMNHKRKIA